MIERFADERECICARLLAIGASIRPCPQHGFVGDGPEPTDSEIGADRG